MFGSFITGVGDGVGEFFAFLCEGLFGDAEDLLDFGKGEVVG